MNHAAGSMRLTSVEFRPSPPPRRGIFSAKWFAVGEPAHAGICAASTRSSRSSRRRARASAGPLRRALRRRLRHDSLQYLRDEDDFALGDSYALDEEERFNLSHVDIHSENESCTQDDVHDFASSELGKRTREYSANKSMSTRCACLRCFSNICVVRKY